MHKSSKYCSCLYYTANALGRAITRMAEEEFAITGLAPSYAFLLMTVGYQPGIKPTGISETMLLKPSTITRLIEKMEGKGFLERISTGRSTEVYLTERGECLIPEIKVAWKNLYHRYADLLGEDMSKQLTTLTFEAVKKMEGIEEEVE